MSVLVRLCVWASVSACLLSLHLFDYLVLVSCESYKRLLNIDILCFTISFIVFVFEYVSVPVFEFEFAHEDLFCFSFFGAHFR